MPRVKQYKDARTRVIFRIPETYKSALDVYCADKEIPLQTIMFAGLVKEMKERGVLKNVRQKTVPGSD